MTSLADIASSIRSLDLGPSPDPSNIKTESTQSKNKITDSQPKPKPQPNKKNSINIPKGPKGSSGAQSSKSQPPKSQAGHPTVYPVYTSLGPPPKAYQFQARAKPGAVPASPKKIRRSPRNHAKRSNSAPIATQASLSSQPLSIPVPPKRQATSPLPESIEKAPQPAFKYVVQASVGSESSEAIIGVYSELERANECAKGYVGRWGIGKSEIVDTQSSFARTARAMRRSWHGGMSEIRVGWAWVKVLPKKFIASKEGDKKMFLAIDRSDGLFVIGVFTEKEPAWEACKKYRDQLTYCSELEGKEQYFDREGMFHLKGKICGQAHHWFVMEYSLDGKI